MREPSRSVVRPPVEGQTLGVTDIDSTLRPHHRHQTILHPAGEVPHASIPVLIISSHDPDLVMAELKSTQIRGFLSKTSLDPELFLAIETILAGGTYFPKPKPPDEGVQGNPAGAEAGN